MFTNTYHLRYGDFKDYDNVKPSSVLDMVQDVSTRHSESLGYGVEKLREMKLAWLVRGVNIKIEKTISTHYPLEISTAVRCVKGVSSERGCIIKQNGKIVAKTITDWFIFSTETQRIAKIPPELADAYPIHNFEDEFFSFKKLNFPETVPCIYSIKVYNKEIDTNKHLNNQKSAELLMDALPFDFNFSDATIIYKKPAMLGDVLNVCMCPLEKGYHVQLRSEQNEICVAGTFELNK